jgi:hypothetical protein
MRVPESPEAWAELSDADLVALTRETVGTRDQDIPREEMTRRLIASNRELHDELQAFRVSSERAAERLHRLTWVLTVLTVALVALTAVLVWRELA